MGPILRTPAEGIDTIIWLRTVRRGEIETGRLSSTVDPGRSIACHGRAWMGATARA